MTLSFEWSGASVHHSSPLSLSFSIHISSALKLFGIYSAVVLLLPDFIIIFILLVMMFMVLIHSVSAHNTFNNLTISNLHSDETQVRFWPPFSFPTISHTSQSSSTHLRPISYSMAFIFDFTNSLFICSFRRRINLPLNWLESKTFVLTKRQVCRC